MYVCHVYVHVCVCTFCAFVSGVIFGMSFFFVTSRCLYERLHEHDCLELFCEGDLALYKYCNYCYTDASFSWFQQQSGAPMADGV